MPTPPSLYLKTSPFHQAILAFVVALTVGQGSIQAQIPDFPLSTEADHDCHTCYDTVRILMLKKVFDLSILLPEWNPVVDWVHSEVIEGTVVPSSKTYTGCHVSQEDFSGYHFTHDFGFDIRPDPPYRRLLARRIYTGHEIEHPREHPDTVIDGSIHVEWESGLAASNPGNPCTPANIQGNSAGFFSAGHRRGDVIWNWPSMGDWVHCVGVWIWDRGHPPSRTEIHPLRFCATRRAMTSYVPKTQGGTDSLFATKIDVFASGDGGALMNNRKGLPPYVHPTKMTGETFSFHVDPVHARPSLQSQLHWRIERRPGDTFGEGMEVVREANGLHITLDWGNRSDTLVAAATVYCWWEDENGSSTVPGIEGYEVTFETMHFNQRKDVSSRPERVIWFEVGGQYLCLNEFIDGGNIYCDGEAKAFCRDWNMGQKLRIYAQPGQTFRVHVGGWESDGINRAFGKLLDPLLPCTKATKKAFHQHLWPATPFTLHGCLDDLIGEVHDMIPVDQLGDYQEYEAMSQGGESEIEQCPGANTEQNDVFRVRYSIRRIK